MEQGFRVGVAKERGAVESLHSPRAHALLILVATVLVYALSLDVPFYFDDYSSIRDNPAIRDFGSLESLPLARIVGYLSFALNYAIHGYELAGYHLINLLIHGGSGLTIFFLTRALLIAPALSTQRSARVQAWLPLLVALLFVLHPLQTQAVTYIVQRLASLAALFYLLSMTAYVKGRLAEQRQQQLSYFTLAGVCGLLGFFTKQNTLTLPIALLLLELCFLHPPKRKLVLALAALGMIVVGSVLLFPLLLDQSLLDFLARSTQETSTVTRLEYFAVQMEVLWTYIAKFFVPLTLHLDYDLPVPQAFWSGATPLFALGHLILLASAVALLRRFPVLAFGILFYYSAHLVESSIIPIRDFGFEHRSYLPNFGLCLALGWVILAILPRYLPGKALALCSAALLLVLSIGTVARNQVWRDPVAFFQHEISVNPTNFRAHSMLGENFLRLGLPSEALTTYRLAYPLFLSSVSKQTNTELAYLSNFVLALDEAGQYDEAISVIDELTLEGMDPLYQAIFLSRRGIVHAKSSRFDQAETDFQAALALDGGNMDALNNYGTLLVLSNRLAEAQQMFLRAYAVDPNNPITQNGLRTLGVTPSR